MRRSAVQIRVSAFLFVYLSTCSFSPGVIRSVSSSLSLFSISGFFVVTKGWIAFRTARSHLSKPLAALRRGSDTFWPVALLLFSQPCTVRMLFEPEDTEVVVSHIVLVLADVLLHVCWRTPDCSNSHPDAGPDFLDYLVESIVDNELQPATAYDSLDWLLGRGNNGSADHGTCSSDFEKW